MIKEFIAVLKDFLKIPNLWVYFGIAIIVILILKSLLKSTKMDPKIFDRTIIGVLVVFLFLTISNSLITEDYNQLWNFLFAFIVVILQKIIPKFIKWYDDKVDRFCEKR